ncbi:MAG: class I SAM-dependent methyltransferase family protein [Nanoarchaeota archaeon]
MLAIRVPLKKAQAVKEELMERQLLDKDHSLKKDHTYIYFPVKKRFQSPYTFKEVQGLSVHEKKSFEDSLRQMLTKAELQRLKTAYDIIGDIAILEVDRELRKKEKLIADLLLKFHKSIKTVLRKDGGHAGAFRTQQMAFLAGEDKRETVHKENSVQLLLDVEKVYFSPRLGTERLRIARQVKPGEKILVMFSGCAPYPCVIGKLAQPKKIVAIEINPVGHTYAIENVMLNRLRNIQLINGDVKKIVPALQEKFDRILMPLPKSAEDFLDVALACAKKGTIIHFYDFQKEEEFKKSVAKIENACKIARKKCKILAIVKCGQHAPYTFRVCVDFVVN